MIAKEWEEVFRNRIVLFTVAFLPLLLTGLPLGILYAMRQAGDLGGMSTVDMPAEFATLCGGLSGAECGQYFLVSQFMLLFMMLPLIIPATIASYSIVGEKTTRTLEPLLATPVTDLELLAGKGLAAAIPAILATWGAFLVYAIGARLLAISPAVVARLADPLWLLTVFLLGPLLALAAVSAAVMISSRVTDPRAARAVVIAGDPAAALAVLRPDQRSVPAECHVDPVDGWRLGDHRWWPAGLRHAALPTREHSDAVEVT